MNTLPLQKAIDICGGQTALAAQIGGTITQGHVWGWLNRSSGLVPPEYCYAIEQATSGKVARKDLRPEDWHMIWPELVDKDAV